MQSTDRFSALLRVATLALPLGLASACSPATEAQSPQGAPPPTVGASGGTPARSPAAAPPSDPLPARLAACAPPEGASPWTVTGRHEWVGTEFVLIEPIGTAGSTAFDPAVLRVGEAGCSGMRVEARFGSSKDDRYEGPDDDTWVTLRDQSFAWHVERAGGAEAFADLYRAKNGPALIDCPQHHDTGTCLPSWRAQQFRDAGVDVARSEPVED